MCVWVEYVFLWNIVRWYYVWGDISGNKLCKEMKNVFNVNIVYLCLSGVRREYYEMDIMVIRF